MTNLKDNRPEEEAFGIVCISISRVASLVLCYKVHTTVTCAENILKYQNDHSGKFGGAILAQ